MNSHRLRIPSALTAIFLAGSPAIVMAGDLGEALAEIVRGASSHYQAPSHYSNAASYSPYTPPPLKADPVARNQHAYDVGYRVGQGGFSTSILASISPGIPICSTGRRMMLLRVATSAATMLRKMPPRVVEIHTRHRAPRPSTSRPRSTHPDTTLTRRRQTELTKRRQSQLRCRLPCRAG